eukprot:scaffold5872_cov104-Isochrysis_galbana.AAC.9
MAMSTRHGPAARVWRACCRSEPLASKLSCSSSSSSTIRPLRWPPRPPASVGNTERYRRPKAPVGAFPLPPPRYHPPPDAH